MLTRRTVRSFQSFLGAALLVGSTSAWAETIVVTDSLHPVSTPAGVRMIELDKPDRLKKELSADLPVDPHLATAVAKQRLASGSGRRITAELQQAYQDVADAWGLGVKKVPAVVVDRKFVVYGITDVALAESIVHSYVQGGQ